MDFKCAAALASGHSKQVTATMPMPYLHPSILSAKAIDGRQTPRQPAGYASSRRRRRARLTAVLNAAAIFLSLAGIALIYVLS